MEHGSDGYTNCRWCSWYSQQRIGKRIGGLGNKKSSGDHPNYCIIEIGQNTEKSPGDLKRVSVTQISVKNHRLTLVGKTRKGVNNNNNNNIPTYDVEKINGTNRGRDWFLANKPRMFLQE